MGRFVDCGIAVPSGMWVCRELQELFFATNASRCEWLFGHVVANENLVISEFEPDAVFAEARFGGSLFAGGHPLRRQRGI